MFKFLGLLAMCLISFNVSAEETFNRVKEREKMLTQLANPPLQNFSVLNSESANSQTLAFLEFFQKEIFPTINAMSLLEFKSGMLHVALDRALFDDDSEKSKWQAEEEQADKDMQKISTDKLRKEKIKKWAELSQGLKGELADFARRLQSETDLAEFSENELPLLNRLTEVMSEISSLSNGSSLVAGLAANEKASNDVIQDFFAKKISFTQAWNKLETLIPQSRNAMGQDIGTRGAKLFAEAAVIRTKLAQSKGFKNWADYSVATQARHHKAPFDTTDGVISFLRKILKDTEPAYLAFLKKQYGSMPGADFNGRRLSQLPLVAVEAESLIREYFPRENIEKVWKQTMLESGFDPAKLETIVLDGYPRAGKYTHAYMNNVSNHMPETLAIDAATLSPAKNSSVMTKWFNAVIYIVQNYRDDGANAWTTAWHEGGHAIDYSYKEDFFNNYAAYGFVETHSMTMEHFFEDVEFLMAVGKTRDGKSLSRELAEKYVLNSRINALKDFRYQVANALYDLLLWKEKYTENGFDFVTKAKLLRIKLLKEATQLNPYVVSGIDPSFSGFTTNHFYSGNVRYFGYILSTVGARMSAEKLWDTMKEKTGRRSFFRQKLLADILINGYYKNGFMTPFPGSIEKFTGKEYSPEGLVKDAVEAVEKYQPCAPEIDAALNRK